jgi:long-chain acyl-CoA synthetase
MSSIATSKTIGEAFLRRAKANGDRVGFRYKKNGAWKDVTFAEQLETVRRLSCGLMELGVKKADKVCILAQTSLAWSQFDMAILGCAGITVPIYPTNTPEDTKYIINHCEASVLFVDDFKNLQKIAAIAKECPNLKKVVVNFEVRASDVKAPFTVIHWSALYDSGLNNEKSLASRFDSNLNDAKSEDIFTIGYTSGTTGLPKGVVLTHSCMQSVMIDVEKVIGKYVTDREQLLSFLPMSHIFGKWESMTPYYMGWTSAYAENLDTLVANLGEVRPTLWVAVPRIFEKVYTKIISQVDAGPAIKKKLFYWALDVGKQHLAATTAGRQPSVAIAAQYKLAKKLVFSKIVDRFGGRMKFCVSGSAPLAKNIQEFMYIVGVPVLEGYGLTETCAPVSVNVPDANKFGTVGRLMPEVLVKIADDGEILIKSEKCFKGYYKNPEATAEAIQNGWFFTGDIGHLDSDGFLCITDRKKDLIKTAGGKFIAPQKVENLAKSIKILSQVVVYGDQKPFATALITLNQEQVIQYAQQNQILFSEYGELVKKPEIQKLVSSAMDELNAQLAKYESIKKFHLVAKEFTVEDGELTPSLKVKRKFLTQKYKAELEALYAN